MASTIKINILTQGIKCMKEQLYQCNKCETVFPPKAFLMNYFKMLIGENPCNIYMYERSLQHVSGFVSHLITHTVEQSIQIDKSETCEETINPDIDNSDQESYNSQPIVNDGRTKVRGGKTFKCNECGESFSKKICFYKHLNTHPGLKPFICSTCNKAYKNKSDLMKHLKIHSGERPPLNCKTCDKPFWKAKRLKLHSRTHIDKKDWERPYKCDFCDNSYNENRDLLRHKQIHTVNKSHQCTYCGKLFHQKQQLTTHLRIHTGEKPYTCEHCGHGSATNQSLLKHIDTHSVDRKKSHQCDICSKCFFTDRDLKTHKKFVHTGEKPYKCRHCDMAFKTNYICLRHERKHTGEKPFKCRQCSKNFYRQTKCCEGLPNIKETSDIE